MKQLWVIPEFHRGAWRWTTYWLYSPGQFTSSLQALYQVGRDLASWGRLSQTGFFVSVIQTIQVVRTSPSQPLIRLNGWGLRREAWSFCYTSFLQYLAGGWWTLPSRFVQWPIPSVIRVGDRPIFSNSLVKCFNPGGQETVACDTCFINSVGASFGAQGPSVGQVRSHYAACFWFRERVDKLHAMLVSHICLPLHVDHRVVVVQPIPTFVFKNIRTSGQKAPLIPRIARCGVVGPWWFRHGSHQ